MPAGTMPPAGTLMGQMVQVILDKEFAEGQATQ